MAKIAHSYEATIEGELGHVGDNEGSAEGSSHLDDPEKFYTDPKMAAVEAVKQEAEKKMQLFGRIGKGAGNPRMRLSEEEIRRVTMLVAEEAFIK